MAKIAYIKKRFGAEATNIIDQANRIITEYQRQGVELTLRQLYYQFVARDLIANKQSEYHRLGVIISDARLTGLVDWLAITDRTRNLRGNNHWDTPGSIIESAAYSFKLDKWATQINRVEIWVEKDALIGIVEAAARSLDVDSFSCRGYTSQSEMWGAGQRLIKYIEEGQEPVIIHLGDHDPSGRDMSRDIEDRIRLFINHHLPGYGHQFTFKRIALNMDQIDEYQPPPNPAKLTDARAKAYIAEFGDESWELDALNPTILRDLITKTVLEYRDDEAWETIIGEEETHIKQLKQAAKEWDRLAEVLANG